MPALDVFKADAFSMASLTNAVNRLPYKPRLLGALGVFSGTPIRTTTAYVEERLGKLSLLPTAARGTISDARIAPRRRVKAFTVPHVPQYQTVMADDVQNIRAFGSETELESLAGYLNEQLAGMRDNHEATMEYHRIGAVKGTILDADGSTAIYDLYAEFGITQTALTFTSATQDYKEVTSSAIRAIGDAMGNMVISNIICLCSDTYFDAVVTSDSVKNDYQRWRDGEFLRYSQLGPEWYTAAANGFDYGNILHINYRGQIGDVPFIPADTAYYFPVGAGNFKEIYAPADMNGAVNTLGQPVYASQKMLDHEKGVELHTQANHLMMNDTPGSSIVATLA